MIQIRTPLGIPTASTVVTPRLWWPLSAIQRFANRCAPCPEREYRAHERMCWECGEPRITCGCPDLEEAECGNCREPMSRCRCCRGEE